MGAGKGAVKDSSPLSDAILRAAWLLLPAYNEAESLRALLLGISTSWKNRDFEAGSCL